MWHLKCCNLDVLSLFSFSILEIYLSFFVSYKMFCRFLILSHSLFCRFDVKTFRCFVVSMFSHLDVLSFDV